MTSNRRASSGAVRPIRAARAWVVAVAWLLVIGCATPVPSPVDRGAPAGRDRAPDHPQPAGETAPANRPAFEPAAQPEVSPEPDAQPAPEADPPPLREQELPQINEQRLAAVRRVAPFTTPEQGDARDPSWLARQFLLALAEEDPVRIARVLHPLSPIRLDPDDASSWSWWRARIGRHLGVEGWGFPGVTGTNPDGARAEVICRLASPPDRVDTSWIALRPWAGEAGDGGAGGGGSGWRVFDAGTALDMATVCPPDSMVYLRLDRSVAQPEFTGSEEVTRRPIESLRDAIEELVRNIRNGQHGAVTARLITVAEWTSSSPPCLADRPPPDDLPEVLRRRMQRICDSDLEFSGSVELVMHDLAGSNAVFARYLLVFGGPNDVRRALITEWRSVTGIYKLAAAWLQPVPANVDELLARR